MSPARISISGSGNLKPVTLIFSLKFLLRNGRHSTNLANELIVMCHYFSIVRPLFENMQELFYRAEVDSIGHSFSAGMLNSTFSRFLQNGIWQCSG